MTSRQVNGQSFALTYDQENHMTGVTGAATANFTYNGDGKRVIAVEGGVTTVYIGNYYEVRKTGGTTEITKYYYAGAQRLALRKNGAGDPTFLFGDHLGSAGVAYDGATTAKQGYKAWGEARYEPDGELATKYRYTGQYEDGYINLYWYGSRWFDPALSRWNQPDSLIPNIYDPLDLDRFAYVHNNPINYVDPTGHDLEQLYYDKHKTLPRSIILSDQYLRQLG